MTIHALSARGASLTYGDNWWVVAPTPLQGITEVIEPDLTTAAVFLAAAVVCGGSVTIKDWPTSSIQPGIRVLDIFEQLGASVTRAETQVSVTGTGTVSGIDIDLSATSELTPLLVGLALFAEGDTRIRGVGHIRGHETNRLSAIATEITALGGYCTETSDGLIIRPAPLGSGIFHSYGDHRMAHLGALIGARIPGITIDDIECTTKTMPGFAHTWQEMFP
jgi:3-phosphoshikimate 1-carboxyvinyltransferase